MQPAALLDDEGQVTDQLLAALAFIFSKYCTPTPAAPSSALPARNSFLSEAGLDRFATETNGQPFDAATKGEIRDFFDLVEPEDAVDGVGGLSFGGFEQMYTLQSENEPEETWKDLAKHGFDQSLQLVNQ